jgi:hypothetical protein
MTYSGSVVLEKKKIKWPQPIVAFLQLSPLWRGSGNYFEQFRIPFIQQWFMPSLIEIGPLVLEKKISFNININIVFPIVAPPDPRGPWCEQFWMYIISESFPVNMTYSGWVILEKIFKWPHPFLHFWDYLLFEDNLALYLNDLEFLLPKEGWFMPSLIEIGLLVLEKKIFFQYKHM